jgi:hypothetical protein
MGSNRQFYEGRRWRIGRFVVGILLVALASRMGSSSVLWPILLFLAIGLMLSAVPWKKLPWQDIFAIIQQQKLSFETSGSYLLKTQKQNYPNWLSIRAAELTTDTEKEKVNVTFELSNSLTWDLSVVELRGSARLGAQIISQDLRLSEPVSSYRLRRLRPSKIKVNFPVEAGILDQLNDKRGQEDKAYWQFELEWKLKFSSGEEVVWKPEEIQFEEVPSIEKESRQQVSHGDESER